MLNILCVCYYTSFISSLLNALYQLHGYVVSNGRVMYLEQH